MMMMIDDDDDGGGGGGGRYASSHGVKAYEGVVPASKGEDGAIPRQFIGETGGFLGPNGHIARSQPLD